MNDVGAAAVSALKPELRVLQVFSNLGIGGAEVWLLALLRYFRDAAASLPVTVKTDVFLTHGVTDALDAEAAKLGATLIYSRYSRSTLPAFVRDWRTQLRLGRYHAVHDHQEFSAGIHFLMGLGHLPRVRIAHLHNPISHVQSYSRGPLRRAAVRAGNGLVASLGSHALSTSNRLLVEHGFAADAYARLHREAVYCGFDTTRFLGDADEAHGRVCAELGLPPDAKIALFVGRLDSNADDALNQKNPAFCLEVAKRCALADPAFHCLIAGSGESVRRRLEARAAEWGLGSRIRLLGRRDDVPTLMLASRLLLLPSLAEGLGMVAVEAQAAGLRVLASDVTPRECAVVPGHVEFLDLAAGADHWAQRALESMAQARPAIEPANALVRASKFSIASSALRLLEIYREGMR